MPNHATPFVNRLARLSMVGALGLWCLALAGCAHPPGLAQAPMAVFDDSQFQPPARPLSAQQAETLSPELRQFIVERLRPRQDDHRDARQRFVDLLNQPDGLRLLYDDSYTRNAAEAFADRRGNCLSLALLTAAIARELDIPVRFQQVLVDEVWSRSHGYTFASGHVNVTLAGALRPSLHAPRGHDAWTVDFVPAEQLRGLPRREIAPHTVLAMYFNNRAVELMVTGQLDNAYAHLRKALRQDPGFAAAYNTLGIVWQRRGRDALARAAYEKALALDANNLKFIGNLLPLLHAPEDAARAAVLAARLERMLPRTPFYWFDQGMAALQRGDPAAAVPLFEREIRRDPDHHEFHFRLAQAHAALGQLEATRHHLQRAAATSTRAVDTERYAAKIAKLRRDTTLQ